MQQQGPLPLKKDMIETRVVDVYNPPGDKDHWVLILREFRNFKISVPSMGKPQYPQLFWHWYTAYIHTATPVTFGDKVWVVPGKEAAYLDKGPFMLYRLDTRCSMPPQILQDIRETYLNLNL